MQQETIKEIVAELNQTLTGGVFGKVFQAAPASFTIDFRRRESGYLFVSADPALPRIHLLTRPTRELEKLSITLSEFGQALRTNLSGSKLTAVRQDESERVVRFALLRQDETGEIQQRTLVAQLTGRSANLFLLDEREHITHAQRTLNGAGQQVGELYAPPPAHRDETNSEPPLHRGSFASLSAAADDHYRQLATARDFDTRAASARARFRKETTRLKKLRRHLHDDLAAHGEAEKHKRMGDLLLANIDTVQRNGGRLRLTDYYAEGLPTVELELDEKTTLQAEAAKYFARYGKAKRAAEQISHRLVEVEAKISEFEARQTALELVIAERDLAALASFTRDEKPAKKKGPRVGTGAPVEKIPGTRRYLSSDGYEILVGRAAKDNDNLTFRIARSSDLWLHAADYPGSHVIVQNQSRKEIPGRTLVEAAQLAAKFSQASSDPKVDVHYTQRKFVARIKGAAPGLVRLSSFKTITVEPKESGQRIGLTKDEA